MAFIPKDARWYLAEIVLEYLVEGDARNVVHVNRHLIEADSPERAFEKAQAIGHDHEHEYANTEHRNVRVVFRGLAQLLVIHDDLGDGAELSYQESIGVPEDRLRDWAVPKEQLAVFAPIAKPANVIPNYMPESVAVELEEAGYRREDFDPSFDKAE